MPASTRLRQLALVAADLQKATHQLKTVIGSEVIYTDPAVEQWGLRNVVLPIGGDMLENVVSPFQGNKTTASRLLSKRGDGGYMIIMQTEDASAQREELDSHRVTVTNPTPLLSRYSPWHALGPLSNFPTYSKQMREYSHLSFLSITCRLAPGDEDITSAQHQWENMFGLSTVGSNGECEFLNKVKLIFLPGREGEKEGLVEVSIGVEGSDKLHAILERARSERLLRNDEWVEMVGIRWKFVAIEGPQKEQESKLYPFPLLISTR